MNYTVPAIFAADAYKIPHSEMYPEGMSFLFSTWVPRGDKIARQTKRQLDDKNEVVFFGITQAIAKITDIWDDWFSRDVDDVLDEYEKFHQDFLKVPASEEQINRISHLHSLGCLPIKILHLQEGTVTRTGVVQAVVYNTDPEFAWVVNYLETLLSTLLWGPQVTATIARNYRKLCDEWAALTCDNNLHVDWQCHDFSMRGLSSLEASSGMQIGHLLYFNGTDTLPCLFEAQKYYVDFEVENFGSVPATEHSVMCAGGETTELETYDRLVSFYKSGIVSIVSDTWDYWNVLTNILPTLQDKIMARDGKVVIRPDSGNPVDIIAGDPNAEPGTPAHLGSIEILWNTFGGTVNNKGYKVLDSHIGLIYGDSITLDRAAEIFERLAAKGFASSNVVLGIGSYTYQCNTRDTWGFAMKATGAVIDGEEKALFKDPITDDGTKKSFKGFLDTRLDHTGRYFTVDGLGLHEAIEDPFGVSQFIEYDFNYPQDSDEVTWAQVRRNAHAAVA